MYIKVIRGIGKIGGNIVEIGTENTKIIFDCGKNLPEIGETYAVDEFEMDGLTYGASKYDAVFLSHYHGDHVGLVGSVKEDIPIYASAETKAYVAFMSACFGSQKPEIRDLPSHKSIKIKEMEVTPIGTKHSAKGAVMYVVSAEGKTVLYTGDFSSPTEVKPMEIDAMLCEGTNIGFESGKIIDEHAVEEAFYQQMKAENKPCFVVASSANVDRVESALKACERCGKILLVELFTYSLLRALHTEEEWKSKGFDKILFYTNVYTEELKSPLLAECFHRYKQYARGIYSDKVDPTKLVAFVTKSNVKWAVHRCFHERNLDKSGVKIMYSLWPGYKKEKRLKQDLAFLKNRYHAQIVDVHASGHITKENLIKFVEQTKPKTIIPIHTEREDVFESELQNVICLQNGEKYEV